MQEIIFCVKKKKRIYCVNSIEKYINHDKSTKNPINIILNFFELTIDQVVKIAICEFH